MYDDFADVNKNWFHLLYSCKTTRLLLYRCSLLALKLCVEVLNACFVPKLLIWSYFKAKANSSSSRRAGHPALKEQAEG